MVQIRGAAGTHPRMACFILIKAEALCWPLSEPLFLHPSVHHHSSKGLQGTGKAINTGSILKAKAFERRQRALMGSFLFANSTC